MTTINIDFDKLDKDISLLKSLLQELDEPNYDKVEFWLGGVTGSGMVRDYLVEFCDCAIDYHKFLFAMIQNTVSYLESVKKLKQADRTIAESL